MRDPVSSMVLVGTQQSQVSTLLGIVVQGSNADLSDMMRALDLKLCHCVCCLPLDCPATLHGSQQPFSQRC